MVDKPMFSRAQLKQETTVKPHVATYSPAELKKADEHLGIIHLISGTTAKGEDFYAYVSVKPSLYDEFVGKLTTGTRMDVDNYGKVLKKGYGKTPPNDVQQMMISKFGLDPNFIDHVTEGLDKLKQEKRL